MKTLLATALFSATCLYSFAQKAPLKFGDASVDDLKMTQYEKDTSASAVILADYGVSSVEYDQSSGDFKLYFERTTRIKIFKRDGYKYVDFEIPLYHNASDKEKMTALKVITYTLENGKMVETKIKSDAIFEEKYDQNTDIIKFTPSNIKEGCLVDVTYKINSAFLFNFRDWEFQSTIPVIWSEYRANIPEYFYYEKFTQGYVPLAVNEVKDNQESITITTKERSSGNVAITTFENNRINYTAKYFRWAAENVPAFKEEPHMTTLNDYLSKINFELAYYKFPNQPIEKIMGTWVDLNASMLESSDFGAAVKGSGFLKKLTDEVTAGQTTPEQKIAAIYNYVKSTVIWDGRYRKFLDVNFKKPLDEKKGSSAEINLLLVSMLQKADMVANPVLVSTRNNGFVRENVAISSQFNYVICQVVVDGKSILLDATDSMLPMHMLPERCLNGSGYIISKDTPGWVSLTAPKSKLYASAEVVLDAEGQLKGNLSVSHGGYFGYKMRKEYVKKGEQEYLKDFAHKMSWQVDKSEFKNIDNLGQSVVERHEFTHLDNFGNASVLYINPLLYLREEENPFKLEERVYPVDFGKTTDQTFTCRITIPENYQPEEMPPSKVFMLPDNAGKYVYNVQVTGNVINFTSVLSINKSLFVTDEYPNLREFYNMVVAKQAEQIVLKKK